MRPLTAGVPIPQVGARPQIGKRAICPGKVPSRRPERGPTDPRQTTRAARSALNALVAN